MLRYSEKEVWKMWPYKIIKLFEYHKEYHPEQFKQEARYSSNEIDDIDIALGGL